MRSWGFPTRAAAEKVGGGHGWPWVAAGELVEGSVQEGIGRVAAWERWRKVWGCSPSKQSSCGGRTPEIDEGCCPLYRNRG